MTPTHTCHPMYKVTYVKQDLKQITSMIRINQLNKSVVTHKGNLGHNLGFQYGNYINKGLPPICNQYIYYQLIKYCYSFEYQFLWICLPLYLRICRYNPPLGVQAPPILCYDCFLFLFIRVFTSIVVVGVPFWV